MAKSKRGLLSKRISRAINEYALIEENDKVLIALSGGKDSLALAWLLNRMARSFPVPFTVKAVHISSELQPPDLAPALERMMEDWAVPFETVTTEIHPLLRPGQDPNCFICAKKRRELLLKYAVDGGYKALALGHHMDDILQTLLMNMVWQAELAAMPPRLDYAGELRMIRPLCLIQEHHIEEFIKEMEWKIPAKHCPWERETRRKEAAERLRDLTGGKDSLKYNMYRSLTNIKTDLLP